jgi:hypothetical protein
VNIKLILEADQVAATATYEGAVSSSRDLNAKYDTVAEICCGFLELSLQLLDESGFSAQANFVLWLFTGPWAAHSWSMRTEHLKIG